MDTPHSTTKATPKDFFLWAGAMATLYGSIVAFITLLFQYINFVYPDALTEGYAYYGDPYNGVTRFSMAALIVLVPVFLILMRLIRRDMALEASRAHNWVRRWALYLTLFIAGATITIDLITLVNYFLNGDTTVRFLLKVAVVLLVAAAGFMHFLADLKGYWLQYPARANMIGYAVGVLVLATIISGFFIIGTPSQARMYRFDERKVNDLMMLQSNIVEYWRLKQELPQTLNQLQDGISYTQVALDPQTNQMYGYRVLGAQAFQLCAVFNADSRKENSEAMRLMGTDTWEHAAGEVCFDRTIDPERYPVYSKPTPVMY